MGVWSRGPAANRVDVPGIAAAMRPALEAWMTGHLQIIDLRRQSTSDYDALADVGGTSQGVVVLDSGPNGALIQPLRAPLRGDVGGQPSGILGIRFQVKRETIVSGQTLRGGLAVKVLDGGNSPGLVGPIYSLPEVIDSSLSWDYIFEATVVTGGS